MSTPELVCVLTPEEHERRVAFPVCEGSVFLAHAAVTALPRAVGEAMAEWILDGAPALAGLARFDLGRFARGDLLVGEHPYESLWR